MSKRIVDNETLFRSVPNIPQMWKPDAQRPSSAVFKDSKGVSVDRDCNRTLEESVDAMRTRFPDLRAIVSVTVNDCHDVEAQVYAKPVKENRCHAEIRRNETDARLSSGMARRLALKAIVQYP